MRSHMLQLEDMQNRTNWLGEKVITSNSSWLTSSSKRDPARRDLPAVDIMLVVTLDLLLPAAPESRNGQAEWQQTRLISS